MPIYEYQCNQCEKFFEETRKRKDPAPVVCPHCGSSDDSQRQISAPNIQFKGSGFYTTDYVRGKVAVDERGRSREKAKLENNPNMQIDSSDGSESKSSDASESTSSKDTSTDSSSTDSSGSED